MILVICSEIDYYYHHYRLAKLKIGRQYQTIHNAALFIRY